jgi:spore photoproduct lyase
MTDTVYIESALLDHPRAAALLQRFDNARVIECGHYGEVFNPRAQSFRLQKQNPALILAEKHDGHVLPAPEGYGLGGDGNYYFSHMLNCIYDCRYCFLQGMYRSAHWVLFVNYETFAEAIDATLAEHQGHACWFFSGYDCDSLAYEPVTGFIEYFLPFFAARPAANLEIRTKSTQIRALLKHRPLDNVVTAFSFTPEPVSRQLEHGVPSLDKRIAAIQSLQQAGWAVGLRFDPMIYRPGFRDEYRDLFRRLFAAVDTERIHSISLGAFRLPKPFYDNMVKQYPDEALFADALTTQSSMVSYPREREQEMIEHCFALLRQYVPAEKLYSCSDIY